jgi:hypothetical protein
MAKSQKFKRGWQFVFVGACLQANRAGQRALPRANNRRQAGSYRGVRTGQQPALHARDGLSLWELACKRIVPVNGHCHAPTIAGRPAPTREFARANSQPFTRMAVCLCGSLPASESCRSTGIATRQQSPAGRLLQGSSHGPTASPSLGGRFVFVGACLQANRATANCAWACRKMRCGFTFRGCGRRRRAEAGGDEVQTFQWGLACKASLKLQMLQNSVRVNQLKIAQDFFDD